jgi:hypothetical protein
VCPQLINENAQGIPLHLVPKTRQPQYIGPIAPAMSSRSGGYASLLVINTSSGKKVAGSNRL